jgi:hypothetical protein
MLDISYAESKVFVNLTKEAILQAPQCHIPPVGTADHDKPQIGTRGNARGGRAYRATLVAQPAVQ